MVDKDEQKPPEDQPASLAELKTLIEKNIKWSQVVYEQNRHIKRRLTWMVAGDYLRLALFIAPIILAAIYLPPIIKDFWDQYGKTFQNVTGTVSGNPYAVSPEQIQQFWKSLGGGK